MKQNIQKIQDNIPNNQTQNGWTVWSKYVLAELVRLNEEVEMINKCLTNMKVDLAVLQFKSGIWGAIGSVVTIAISIGIWFLTKVLSR